MSPGWLTTGRADRYHGYCQQFFHGGVLYAIGKTVPAQVPDCSDGQRGGQNGLSAVRRHDLRVYRPGHGTVPFPRPSFSKPCASSGFFPRFPGADSFSCKANGRDPWQRCRHAHQQTAFPGARHPSCPARSSSFRNLNSAQAFRPAGKNSLGPSALKARRRMPKACPPFAET